MKLGPVHIDGFLAAMLSAVALALLAPGIGRSEGPLHLGTVTGLGIALVFLLHGANLAPEKLVAGMRNWRLHLFVQTCTFVLFPVIGTVLAFVLDGHVAPALLTGVYFLCVLPSTISSSVAFTAMAGGNVGAAVFNATLSNFIGIIVTPLLVSQWMHATGASMPIGQAILGVAVQLLLPFIAGQFLRPHLHAWLVHHKSAVNRVDRGVIVLIVYSSFCDSAAAGLWSGQGWVAVLQAFGLCVAILAGVLSLTCFAARRFGFTLDDEVVAVFCGSKKSVASGIPMARLLFGSRPELGMIVLPAMLYHQVQLLVCANLARRYARVTHAGASR
ncbi:MAG TPA: bile acid:sodium symporter family protein [Aromatoleum sp.]|uniref:bile acid:sodium symporter family protein n=1 Tax=Aromatoleum sp. TaxID=2307007 RepID=UPI002B49D64A|nr:bile acid:sodium symporter family protein [Aromatoleum sp.]HJV27342.1 bile acid:sodium symporter family protein [Aromatoleum sp.]